MLRRLGGRPLLSRIIQIAAGAVAAADQIMVITDDDEAALLAERMGCRAVVHEDQAPAGNGIEWPHIYRAITQHEQDSASPVQTVSLLQPYLPLLQAADFHAGCELLAERDVDSVVALGQHSASNGGRRPVESRPRVDRLAARDLGALAMSKRRAISPQGFLGRRIKYTHIPAHRAFEVHSPQDWWVCEKLLAQKRIVFVVAGYNAIGMGHVYRGLLLAHELMDHEIIFVCTRESELAARQLAANKYSTHVQTTADLAAEVLALKPDLVINDFLDTDGEYVRRLKESAVRVVNIEDMGSGAAEADMVINALYEQEVSLPNHRTGPEYFCLRDEFLQAAPSAFHPEARQVLITFGGTDAPDLTGRIFELIYPLARQRGLRLSIVTGPGYLHIQRLQQRVAAVMAGLVEIANGTKRMSEYMAKADLAFSSAGRTVFELVSMRVPAIILAANRREETHTFASAQNGLTYLGRHDAVRDSTILKTLQTLLDEPEQRRTLYERMCRHDFRSGKKRVIDEIQSLLYAPIEEDVSYAHADYR